MCIRDLFTSQLGGTPWSAHPSNTLLLCILYFVFVVVGLYFFRLSVYYWSSQLPIRRHSMIGSSLKYIALLYFVFVGVLYLFLKMCISDLLIHQLVGTSRWTHPSKPPKSPLAPSLRARELIIVTEKYCCCISPSAPPSPISQHKSFHFSAKYFSAKYFFAILLALPPCRHFAQPDITVIHF